MESIIGLEDVHFLYPDGTPALKGITLRIPHQGKTALLGPNGAGKTTLLLHLNGIYRPTRGAVYFEGSHIRHSRSEINLLRRQIGIVFQDPELQLLGGTVYQDLSFGPANLNLNNDLIHKRVKKALELSNLIHLADRPVHSLSYGQKKRVAIAGVLAMEPRVIALDEPTASLDPCAAVELMELMDSLNAQGTTVIISTHDVDLAVAWAKQLVIMEDGRIQLTGTAEQIYKQKLEAHRLNLNVPFVVEVYWHLIETGLATGIEKMPRNRKELLNLIHKPGQTEHLSKAKGI